MIFERRAGSICEQGRLRTCEPFYRATTQATGQRNDKQSEAANPQKAGRLPACSGRTPSVIACGDATSLREGG